MRVLPPRRGFKYHPQVGKVLLLLGRLFLPGERNTTKESLGSPGGNIPIKVRRSDFFTLKKSF